MRPRRNNPVAALAVLAVPAVLSVLSALPAAAAAAEDAAAGAAVHPYFSDTVLVDQDGREVRFYSDLIHGKIVVMDFIFTRCVGPCPILSGTFAKLQSRLGDRLGKDVFLLSFSVDPDYDTPERLKEYAGRFRARPGWSFLTGSRANVETVLRKLGQWVESPDQHQTVFILGNEVTGLWKKAFGLAKPEDLFPVIDSVVDDPGSGG
jgi:protein SCO1/2